MNASLRALWWVCLSVVLVFSSSLSAKKHVPHYFANTVTIVIPVDEPPVAVADHFTVIEDVPRVLDVLSNDTDENPATLFITIVSSPVHGVLSLSSDNRSLTYSPNTDFRGNDSVTYFVTDEEGQTSETVTVSLVVTGVNDAPQAFAVSASVSEDAVVTIAPSASDADGNVLAYQVVSAPANGSVMMLNNQFVYTPVADFHGSDPFSYVAFDGHDYSAPATVSVNVMPVNDAPVAVDSQVSVDEDTVLNIVPQASDIEGDALSYTVVAQPGFGNVSVSGGQFVYVPDANFHGNDVFRYIAHDGMVGSSLAEVRVSVNAVNDMPVGVEDNIHVAEGSEVLYDVIANDLDVDGDSLKILTAVNVSPHLEVSVVDPRGAARQLRVKVLPGSYTPGQRIRFVYDIEDGTSQLLNIGAYAVITNINNAPVAVSLSGSVSEDNATSFAVSTLGSDADGDSLSVTGSSAQGSVTSDGTQLHFTPNTDFHGTATVNFTVSDGQYSDSGVITVTVTPVNDAPVAMPDMASVSENASIDIDVLANDSDADNDTLTIVPGALQAQRGSVSIVGNLIRYTPQTGFYGTDIIGYQVSDAAGVTASSTVTVNVNDVNFAPVAQHHTVSINEDTPLQVDLSALVSDPDGDSLSITQVSAGVGTVAAANNNASGPLSLDYTPPADFYGQATLTYQVSDGEFSARASITVNIAPVNDAPVFNTSGNTGNNTGNNTGIPPSLISMHSAYSYTPVVTDVDNTPAELTFSVVNLPGWANLNTATGHISGTPALADVGTYSGITLSVTDGPGSAQLPAFHIEVREINLAPVAPDLWYSTDEDTPLRLDLLAMATDSNNDALSVVSFSSTGGTLVPVSTNNNNNSNNNSLLDFTPPQDASGSWQVLYTLSDGELQDSGVITVSVEAVNDPPQLSALTPPGGVTAGEAYQYQASATDVDHAQLSWSLEAASGNTTNHVPVWLSIDNTGLLSGTPTADDVGTTDNLIIRVTDADNASDTFGPFSIEVHSANVAPTLSVSAPAPVNVGQTISVTPVAEDADGDNLTFSLSGAPAWLSVNTDTGQITGTPAAGDQGLYSNIILSVSDGQHSVSSDALGIEVLNIAPTFSNTPSESVVAGQLWQYTPVITDPDGDTLSFSVTGAPDWASLDSTTGTLSGTPGLTQTGTTSGIVLEVSDGIDSATLSAFSLTVLTPTSPDWANTGSSTQHIDADGSDSITPLDSTFNGAIPGEAGVSGGGAVYNIPIVVPPGRNGVQPSVSLNFSSRSGMGIAGVGWSLSAGSSISRCPRTVVHDGRNGGINYDMNDRLCLDGQRLIPLVGDYGKSNTTYTTEMESFITVTQHTADLNQSGVSFTVNLPDGGTRTYGTDDSRRIIADGKAQALSWLIHQYTDVTDNNTMTYHYTPDQSHGEILLSKITYTENGGTATTGATEGNRQVHFDYEDSEKYSTSYLAGGKTRSTKRLKAIETQYNGSKIRDYTLSYQISAASGRPLLTQVKECGYQHDSAGQCRALTSFEWADDAPHIVTQVMTMTKDGTSEELFPGYDTTINDGTTRYVPDTTFSLRYDLDGNGVRDWININADNDNVHDDHVAHFINAEGIHEGQRDASFIPLCVRSSITHKTRCIEVDFNQDGISDPLTDDDATLRIHLSAPATDGFNFAATDTGISLVSGNEFSEVIDASDYNGDGLADIIIKRRAGNDYLLELHTFNPGYFTGTTTQPFNTNAQQLYSIPIAMTLDGVEYTSQDAQFVGDMNNDGLSDFVIQGQVASHYMPSLLTLLLSETDDAAQCQNSTTTPCMVAHDIHFNHYAGVQAQQHEDALGNPGIARSMFSYAALVDVNGDGLSDWLGNRDAVSLSLAVRINKGDGSFGAPSDLLLGDGSVYTLPETTISMPGSTAQDPEQAFVPRLERAFSQLDVDGDGKTELLMPGAVVVEACATIQERAGGVGSGYGGNVRCGNALEGTFITYQNAEQNLDASLNRSVYRYQALHFEEQSDGRVVAQVRDTQYYGTVQENQFVDAFGKGLQDLVFSYGCAGNSSCEMDTQYADTRAHFDGAKALFDQHQGSVLISRHYGSVKTTHADGTPFTPGNTDYIPVDMMLSASNGVGLTSTWDYSPLSSDEYSDANNGGNDTFNKGAFYNPARESFADGEHFNFASSMYVVASFKQSNGVGGENETRYQYAGAVFNNQGRGFRGFKSITERTVFTGTTEDISLGTTTHTQFLQKFPFSSAVTSQTVLQGGNAGTGCLSHSVSAPGAAVSLSADTPDSACKILSQTLTAHALNPHTSAAPYLLYQPQSRSLTFDPTDYEQISSTTVTTDSADLDAFGNAQQRTTMVEDAFGVYTTVELGTYTDADRSWPDRYSDRTVVKKAVNRTNKDGLTLPANTGNNNANLDTDRVVKTDVIWDEGVRKPKTVTVKYGDGNAAASATATATVTTTDYNTHGLPDKVSVAGNVLTGTGDTSTNQTRTVSTTYTNNGTTQASDGYFPYQITQENGGLDLVTTTHTNPATGLPTQVTDVSGVVTDTTYDSLARPLTLKRTGFPTQYLRYRSSDGDTHTISHAVMSIQTQQAGAPNSLEFKDLLGRTLRSATQAFDGNYVYQDMAYNHRGQVTSESHVYTQDSTAINTTYSGFDVLGRPGTKVTPGTNGSLTTTYTYDGLTTQIDVDATTGADLTMSRTYNALEQLMETIDANTGACATDHVVTSATKGCSTRYAYDGSGNPVIIQDAKGHQIQAQYDALGRKNYVSDPNMGTTTFVYNDFGELEKETDARGISIRYDMDLLGRVIARYADNEDTATFNWDRYQVPGGSTLTKKGLLIRQQTGEATTTFTYDNAARITDTTVNINQTDYVTSTVYDSVLGRPKAMVYPKAGDNTHGLTVAFEYNAQGYLTTEKNAQTGYIYRKVTKQDALGNITEARLNNNGLTATRHFHHVTGQMLYTRATNGHNENVHDISYYDDNDVVGYDSYGNLTHQTNGVSGALESYTYDKLHRLTQSDLAYSVDGYNATQTIDYAYDVVGNILKKTDYSLDSNSAYTYQSGSNKIHSIHLKDNTTVYFGYDNSGNQISRGPQADNLTSDITYNAFNKPTVITKNQQNINLFYGADLMRYKQTKVVDNQIVTTWYIGKHFEIEEGLHNTTYRHFISDIAIVNTYSNQLPDILFTHRDRLGSAVTMTNEHDVADIRRYFDPFGKPRVGTDWSLWESISLPARLMNLPGHEKGSYKGFTDHEHLDEAELIHMNGRVYDYHVGRFMSVDPLIHMEGGSQGINSYSYIMNNPLAGTDPTGYDIEESKEDIKESRPGSRIKVKVGERVTTTVTDRSGKVTSTTVTDVMNDGSYSGTHLTFNDNGAITSATTFGTVKGQHISGTGITAIGSRQEIAEHRPEKAPSVNVGVNPGNRPTCVTSGCGVTLSLGVYTRSLEDIDHGIEEMQEYATVAAGVFSLPVLIKSILKKGIKKASFGSSDSNDYRSTFFEEHPDLQGEVWVHHAVERQVQKRYSGLVNDSEMHSLENLRGIPKEINNDVHLSKIRKEWNSFYKTNPNPTKQQLLDKATEIDDKFGKQFNPPVR